jgi:hypothetical protein
VDLYAARANSASWPGDTVVPLGRLAARPTPMTDADVRALEADTWTEWWESEDKDTHRSFAWRLIRRYERVRGIAHPSPAGAGDDTTDTTTRETR